MGIKDQTAALRIVSILLLIAPLFPWGSVVHAQWLEGYSHRAKITIDESLAPGSTDLEGFPFLFSYTDTLIRSTEHGGDIHFSDGRDLCFTDQDGITILEYEIESFDPESGSLAAWIRIPFLSAESATEMFFYYSNPDTVPNWDTAGVWSNQYTAVWHLQDDPSEDEPQITDATTYKNHGTTGGNMDETNRAEGKIGGALYFDGDENFCTMPVSGFNMEEGSVELWVYLDSISDSGSDYFFSHRRAEPTTDRVYLRVWPDGEWGTGMGSTYDLERGDTLETVTWHHMAITWKDTVVTGYLDGEHDFGPVSFTGLDTVREIYIMTWEPSSESASGILDELRVSDVARDSAWIVASYLNQNQPETWYQVEAQPVNDLSCQAIQLNISDSCMFSTHSNMGARGSGIPDPGCGNYLGGDIWFYVVVPDSGDLEIQTDTEAEAQFPLNDGWMYRAAMAIYSGHCDSLVFMGCYENNSTYHPRMAGAVVSGQTPGDTLWVRIWENANNDNGMLKICATSLDQDQCPTAYEVSGGGAFCEGEQGVAITLSGSEHGYRYTLLLNDTMEINTRMGFGDTLNWSPIAESGIYTVLAYHPSQECSLLMSDSAIVTVLEVTQLSFEANSVTCFDFNDGAIHSTISGGKEPFQLEWSGPDGFFSSQPDLTNLSPGSYTLTVLDSNLCANTGPDILITEPDLLVASLEQVMHLTGYEANDGTIDISIAGGTTPYETVWTGTDDYNSSDQDPTGMSVGYYEVMVTDAHGCKDAIEKIVVSVEEDSTGVFIPEGFSPNGDGFNDLFVILGIENHPENELVVFNRQGVEVFHCMNYKNDWDGTPEKGGIVGGTLPEGTYYYVFVYGETSVRKGFIYLNRE